MTCEIWPKSTDELVQRLEKLGIDSNGKAHGPNHNIPNRNDGLEKNPVSIAAKETSALLALSVSMIQVLSNEPKTSYALEATKLTRVTNQDNYKALFEAFINAIARGTSDSNILDDRLLTAFTEVLSCPLAKTVSKQLPLGSAMNTLTRRLETAGFTTNDSEQYYLILSLSAVLDEMNEVKTRGINEEKMIQPLLTLLSGCCEHQDLRIAQAAEYAYQALLGIPSDNSPWKVLGKHTYGLVLATSALAGSATTMDPSKLVDSFAYLAKVPQVVESIVDLIKEMGSAKGASIRKKQARWYFGLRYTDMLIRGNAPQNLKSLLENPKLACREDKDFLCGICAQLKKAKEAPSPNIAIIQCLNNFLVSKDTISKYPRLQEWVTLATDATEPPKLRKSTTSNRLRALLGSKSRTYSYADFSRKPQPQESHSELLEKGWKACLEARLFYADQAIRNQYTSPERERLKIERLSGEILPLDRCYINLSIVRESAENSESDVSQNSSIENHRPSYWDQYSNHREVSLSELFIQDGFHRKKHNLPSASEKDQESIMRVLIRGQAGVGKSTLCKKIVHEFIHNDMWADDIDRIIWLPLRDLKGSKLKFIEELFREQYFANTPDSQLLVDALCTAFNKDKTRTLFLADGFDEVFTEVTEKSSDILLKVLEQPRAIITSRPYAVNHSRVKNIHREYDTIGFYPHQVEEYIAAVAKDQADKIQAFTTSHPIIEGLARIPIQLDAICYSFKSKEMRGSVNATNMTTMTELYQAVEKELWNKDVEMLEKRHEGKLVTKGYALTVSHSSIRELVRRDINALRALAFTGLYQSMVEFDGEFLGDIFTKHEAWGGDGRKLSFIRSSHGHPIEYDRTRSYHFLHLTFQEYFAAQYFVEHWKSNTEIPYAGPGTTARDFLRKEKYNPRYDILWRFVAGLLQADSDEDQLCRFFSTVEQEPRDLFGPGHQRLVMRCLSEVDSSRTSPQFSRLRAALEDQLKQWLVVECSPITAKGKRELKLAADPEFPSHILAAVAREGSLAVKLSIMESISPRANLAVIAAEVPPSLLIETTTISVGRRYSILGRFKKLGLALPVEVLQVLVKQLGSDIGPSAATVLDEQLVLPEVILKDVKDQLCDSDIQKSVTNALGGRQLSAAITQVVVSLLDHPDVCVRTSAVNILGKQKILPDVILQTLAELLKDPDQSLRVLVFDDLSKRPLPKSIDKVLARLLETQEPSVRLSAIRLLGKQSTLSEAVLQTLVQQLGDLDENIMTETAFVLHDQEVLPDTILQYITRQLETLKKSGWDLALCILGKFSAIPEVILQVATERLLHPTAKWGAFTNVTLTTTSDASEAKLRDKAIKLCNGNGGITSWVVALLDEPRALPEAIIQAVMQQLHSADAGIRKSAISSLYHNKEILPVKSSMGFGHRMTRGLPGTILELLAKHLDHSNEKFRRQLLVILGSQPSCLTDTALQCVVKLLDHPDERTRRRVFDILWFVPDATYEDITKLLENPIILFHAAQGLEKQTILPDAVVEDMWKYLEHPMPEVRKLFSSMLIYSDRVPEVIFQTLAKLLEKPGPLDTELVSDALKRQGRLPIDTMLVLASLLESPNGKAQELAAEILVQQDILEDDILQGLISLLNNPNKKTQESVVEVLGQRNLSDPILQVIAGLLYSSDPRTQRLASRILAAQMTLPDAVLQDFAKLLEDEGSTIETKRLVINAIPTHSTYQTRQLVLTESLIQALAKQLQSLPEDISAIARIILCDPRAYPEAILWDIERHLCYIQNPDAVGSAKTRCEQLLLVDERICASVLANMNDKVFNKVFRTWQGQSFIGKLVWYADGDMSYLETSSGTQKLPMQALRRRVEDAHKFFDDPHPVDLDAVWKY